MKNPIRSLLALSLLGTLPALANPPPTRALSAQESLSIVGEGNRAHLVVSVPNAPARSGEVRIFQGERFVAWSAPLTLNAAGQGRVDLDARGAYTLLVADRVALAFTDAEGTDLQILTAARATLSEQFPATAGLVRGTAPFFQMPEGPVTPAMPTANVSREEIDQFVNAIRQWDAGMAAHVHRFGAARSQARSLWTDLRTAGRIPWGDAVIQSQDQAYRELQVQIDRMVAERNLVRERARDAVQAWRAANPARSGELALTFMEIS
jgi:hypothetical protein